MPTATNDDPRVVNNVRMSGSGRLKIAEYHPSISYDNCLLIKIKIKILACESSLYSLSE